MCFGGGSKQPAPTPPPPPAPPVLEQTAPEVVAPTESENQAGQASGSKKYRSTPTTRSSLAINTAGAAPSNSGTTSNGLGISM